MERAEKAEIAPVEGGDACHVQAFGNGHNAAVDQIQFRVRIFAAYLAQACKILPQSRFEPDHSILKEVQEIETIRVTQFAS